MTTDPTLYPIMSSAEFNIILPSNSNPKIFPENKPSEYSVEFAKPLYLSGPHEVALTEVTYYNDISLLTNNYFEIHTEVREKDDCFRLFQNGLHGTWDFHHLTLHPFSPSLPSVKNMIKIEKAYATSSFNSTVPTLSLQDTENEIGKMFRRINDLFTLTLNRFFKPVVKGSTKLLKEGRKHVLLILGRDLAHTLGFPRTTFSSLHWYNGLGWKAERTVSDFQCRIAPLYALQKRSVRVKEKFEVIKNIEDVARKFQGSVPESLMTCEYKKEKVTLFTAEMEVEFLVFTKKTPLEKSNSAVIEFGSEIQRLFKHPDSPPCLTELNDTYKIQLNSNKLKTATNDAWHINVYSDKILADELSTSTELVRRVNLNVEDLNTPSEICTKLNENGAHYLNADEYFFSYDPLKKRMVLKVGRNYLIKLDKMLATILGFSKFTINEGTTIGNSAPSLERDISNLYIYCNIVEYTRVGDIEAPLLRTFPLSSVRKQLINREFINKMYLPINRSVINRIDISIHDDAGEIVPFYGGVTVLTLHIKNRD